MKEQGLAEPERFGGTARLLGEAAMERLTRSHVAVVGLGGVGSWTVEALARSAVGALTLIDPDEICLTNINRQLPALASTVGQSKAGLLAARVADISPDCQVRCFEEFLLPGNVGRLLEGNFDYVVDAVDRMSIKALILAHCRDHQLPVLTIGGAGGRVDPARVQIQDLGRSGGDELLRQVRRKLRRDYGWQGGEGILYGVPAVFSNEPLRYPQPDGCVALEPASDAPVRMDCAQGIGSAAFVTGVFGMMAAAEVVKAIGNQ